MLVRDEFGVMKRLTLLSVSFMPRLMCNLLSLTRAISNGFRLGSKHDCITLEKSGLRFVCKEKFKTGGGYLCGPYMKPLERSLGRCFIAHKTFHEQLGHPGVEAIARTAKDLKIKLDDEAEICKNCELAKSRRQNLNKFAEHRATTKCERVFVDTSWINEDSVCGARYWILVIDEVTKFC